MIPAPVEHQAVIEGAIDSMSFEISTKDSAHLMAMMRDTLYTDKVMAVLREYGANAWDAHRMVGKNDVPINVQLPTREKPVLVIRDYGPGMSVEQMHSVFTQYGASLKRDSNTAVGMLGIGSKAGFSYSDSFQVTSFNGGMKRIYVAAMDASNKGNFSLLFQEPTEETGFEVRLSVNVGDVDNFHMKAKTLFQHFDPRPVINTPLPEKKEGVGQTKSGIIFRNPDNGSGNTWTAVMGCVPYRLNMKQIEAAPTFVKESTSGVLFFDIGEVDITASREELKYSDRTKAAVAAKVDAVLTEFSMWALNAVMNAPGVTDWERRWKLVAAASLVPSIKALPRVADYISGTVSVAGNDQFSFYTNEKYRGSFVMQPRGMAVPVNKGTQFIFAEHQRGYPKHLRNADDVIAVPMKEGVTVDDLKAWVATKGISGVPVITVPEMRKDRGYNDQPKKAYPRTIGKIFSLMGEYGQDRRASQWKGQWKAETAFPDGPFILVPLDRFAAPIRQQGRLKRVVKALGQEMPPIYGVRKADFDSKASKVSGWKSYEDYKKEVLEGAVATFQKQITSLAVWRSFGGIPSSVLGYFRSYLPDHDLTKLLESSTVSSDIAVALTDLLGDAIVDDATKQVEEVTSRYPLFNFVKSEIWHGHEARAKVVVAHVADYIKMVDARRKP
jgi:hypothetical protein